MNTIYLSIYLRAERENGGAQSEGINDNRYNRLKQAADALCIGRFCCIDTPIY